MSRFTLRLVLISLLLSLPASSALAEKVPDYPGDSPIPKLECDPVLPGVLAEIHLDGDAQDISGQANHGTVVGALGATNRRGEADACMIFDGIDDLITMPSSESLRVGTYSISLWFRTSMAIPSYNKIFLFSGRYSQSLTESCGFQIRFQGDGSVWVDQFTTPDGNFGAGSLPGKNDGEWHHVVATWNGRFSKIYMDGVLEGTFDVDDYPQYAQGDVYWVAPYPEFRFGYLADQWRIDNSYASPEFFEGEIDDFLLLDGVIDQEGVEALYLSGGDAVQFGARMWFAEEPDVISIPSFDELRVGHYTLSAWVNTGMDLQQGQIVRLFSAHYSNALYDASGFELRLMPGGIFIVNQMTQGTGNFGAASAGGKADRNWHHVVATWDGQVSRIFVDGAHEGSFDVDDYPQYEGGVIRWSQPYGDLRVGGPANDWRVCQGIQDGTPYVGWLADVRLLDFPVASSAINAGYSADNDPTIGTDTPSAASRVASLQQNYPNPFNPRTNIKFVLAETSTVDLRVFDARGRVVQTLLEGESMAGGEHSFTWSGRNDHGRMVGSGVYFYQIRVNGKDQTKKMTLVK